MRMVGPFAGVSTFSSLSSQKSADNMGAASPNKSGSSSPEKTPSGKTTGVGGAVIIVLLEALVVVVSRKSAALVAAQKWLDPARQAVNEDDEGEEYGETGMGERASSSSSTSILE